MLLEQLLWVFWDFLITAFTDIRTVPLPLVAALSKMVTLGKKNYIFIISQMDPCNLITTKRCPRYLLW